jgi:C-terminal processing protease CtpA/Prc
VVGEVTFGKSFVQLPIKLSNMPDYTLKVTVATYVTPLGNWLRPRSGGEPGGIVPDAVVELTEAEQTAVYRRFRTFSDSGEPDQAPDRQLDAALAYLMGRAVSVRMDRVE